MQAQSVVSPHAPLTVKAADVKLMEDSLSMHFGKRKKIPEHLRSEVLYALSYYPELKNVRITFREKKIATTMEARPTIWSAAFRRPHKRHYLLIVNRDSTGTSPLIQAFTFNARVGLIGHELAHLLYYTDTRMRKIVHCARRYKQPEFRSNFEKMTDKITVERGLGWQLYDFSSQVQTSLQIPESYKAFKRKFYLTPLEIYDLMRDNGYRE